MFPSLPSAREKSTIFFILYVLNVLNLGLKMKEIAKIAVFKLFMQKSEQKIFG